MTTVFRRGWWLLALLAPICWWAGEASAHSHVLIHAALYEALLYLFVPGAIAGLLLGLVARTLGLPAIRDLLSPAQAVLFGTLASALVAITLTGVAWATFKEDEAGQLLWIILSGAATLTFFGIWSLLAMRVAAATKSLSLGATLIISAFAAHAIGLWGLALLAQWLDRHQPEPSVPIALAIYLLVTIIVYLPITLAACGTAGLVGGLGRRPLAASVPPVDFPADPIAPFVPPTAVPTQSQAQPRSGEEYHGEEPSSAPAYPASAPVTEAPSSSAPQPANDDIGEEVPAPSETDRG